MSKYPIKYLELVFALTNFEITILSVLTSQIFIGFFVAETFLLLLLSPQISTLLYYGIIFSDYFIANWYDDF